MSNAKKVINKVQKNGILRSRDLADEGIPRATLSRLEKKGTIRRIARGLYELADADPTEHIGLMEVCKRVPRGIVCLISALNFHEMTTQMPFDIWIAIGAKAHKPTFDRHSVRVVRFSGKAATFGVETHAIQGVELHVTSPAKTVADCFKFRNKIGTDVAIEALKKYIRQRKGTMDELWQAAQVCRVRTIMTPYIEAMQ